MALRFCHQIYVDNWHFSLKCYFGNFYNFKDTHMIWWNAKECHVFVGLPSFYPGLSNRRRSFNWYQLHVVNSIFSTLCHKNEFLISELIFFEWYFFLLNDIYMIFVEYRINHIFLRNQQNIIYYCFYCCYLLQSKSKIE